jgi:hypothetical protein
MMMNDESRVESHLRDFLLPSDS